MVQIFVFNIVLMIKLFKADCVRYEKSSNIVQNNSSIRNERHDPLLLEGYKSNSFFVFRHILETQKVLQRRFFFYNLTTLAKIMKPFIMMKTSKNQTKAEKSVLLKNFHVSI